MSVDKQLLPVSPDIYSNPAYLLGLYTRIESAFCDVGWKAVKRVFAAEIEEMEKRRPEAEVDVETRWVEIKPGCEMPTHKQKVDIWIQIGDNPGWRFPYAEWVATSDGPWWCNDDGETIEEAYVYGDDGFHCVTHWMPLPAAPVAVEYQGKDK